MGEECSLQSEEACTINFKGLQLVLYVYSIHCRTYCCVEVLVGTVVEQYMHHAVMYTLIHYLNNQF